MATAQRDPVARPGVFKRPERAVDRVFLHCSASDEAEHDSVAVMREWHLARGWSDVGYHFFIRKSGEIEIGRDLERTPAAQAGHNAGTIAICVHGLALDRFTPVQFEALYGLCAQIRHAYSREITFHGHHEVAPKACPVFPYWMVLRLDAEGYMSESLARAEVRETEATAVERLLSITDQGDDVRRLQCALNRAGIHVALLCDELFGRKTLAAVVTLQRMYGLASDGVCGPQTWALLHQVSAEWDDLNA